MALVLGAGRYVDKNLSDRVPPVVNVSRQILSNSLEPAVLVDEPLSGFGHVVPGGIVARRARDVHAKLGVDLGACTHSGTHALNR